MNLIADGVTITCCAEDRAVRVDDVFSDLPFAVGLLLPDGDVLALVHRAAHAHLVRPGGIAKIAGAATSAFVAVHVRENPGADIIALDNFRSSSVPVTAGIPGGYEVASGA